MMHYIVDIQIGILDTCTFLYVSLCLSNGNGDLPSDKHTTSYGTSPLIMFNSYVRLPEDRIEPMHLI